MIYLLIAAPPIVALYFIHRLFHYMARVEPFNIEVTRHEVCSAELPRELDGFTICQLSDLHISSKPRNRETIAEAVRDIRADLYVLTGDMIYDEPGIEAFLRWFDEISDAIRPTIAILGNAEHKPHFCTSGLLSSLRERAVTLLVNESVHCRPGSTEILVIGVDDPHTRSEDFEAAYAGTDPNCWTLLLCHSPDGLATIGTRRADLMLCGHTHGGQIALQPNGWRWPHTHRVKGFVAGWYDEAAIKRRVPAATGVQRLYISRGLGMGYIPLRLNSPPEIAVFVLRRVDG